MDTILDQTNSSDIMVWEGLQEIQKWKPALIEEQRSRANLVVIDDQAPDELRCTLNAFGKFRVSEYVEKYRVKQLTKEWTGMVWNKFVTYHVQAFVWKVYRGAISVDRNIQRRGIPLTSRHVCCYNPHIETLDHLMVKSDIPHSIWDHFAHKLHKSSHVQSIAHLHKLWLHGVSRRTQMGMTIVAIFFYGMWEI